VENLSTTQGTSSTTVLKLPNTVFGWNYITVFKHNILFM
jgi:hypothetical protein